MRKTLLVIAAVGCVFWIGGSAIGQPPAKTKAPEDLLKQQIERLAIEENKLAKAVDEAIRQSGETAKGVLILKDMLSQVRDHQDISAKMRDDLITRLQSALRDQGANVPPKGKKKPAPDRDARPAAPKPEPVRVRWEYHVDYAGNIKSMGDGSLQAGLNKLGADFWELVALETGTNKVTAYIFRRPAAEKPKADGKPAADPAPKEKAADRLETRVYALKHTSAPELVPLLDEVLRAKKNNIVIAADPRSNQLVVNGSPRAHADIEALLQRLDVEEAPRPGGPGLFVPGGGGGFKGGGSGVPGGGGGKKKP
ncbi:MAG: hypothetical protein HY289_01485 [Planctomycetes bacterium]|nr:hypothetical protein [Planctomycetota bacterium]